MLLGLEREGVHVDTRGRGAAVVLVRLHAVEVAALTLSEAVLSVELELRNLHGVLARALDTGVEDNLREEVVGGGREDLLTEVGARVEPRRTAQRRAGHDAEAREVRTRRAIAGGGGDGDRRRTADERAAGEDIHDNTLSGEVVRVVERLAAVDLADEVDARGAVRERVALDNPHKLLDGVVEVQLDLVAGGRDRLSTSVLELLDEVLVGLLGEAATLLRVEVDVVNVEGGSREGLDGGGRGNGASLLIVAAVDPLLELNVDADLVVLESDEGDRKTGVTAEPELEGDVEGLGRGARTRGAGVGELRTGARGIEGVTLAVLHEDEVVGVADHVIESLDGARILGELGPDLEPVAILTVNALATDLELHNLDEAVADVVEPAEAGQVGATVGEVNGRENNLNVGAVHQIRIAVDDGSNTLVKVGLAVEGDLNGLHGEVGVALVEHLPEGDLGVTRDVDILRTVRDKLKKTATHVVLCSMARKIFSAHALHVSPFLQVTLSTQGHVNIVSANKHLFVGDAVLSM